MSTDKSLYDRTESVLISGTLVDQASNPMSDKAVSIAITPPSGDAYTLPSAITDASGGYSAAWEIPDDAVGGTYTISVASLGATGTSTFTQSKWIVENLTCRVPTQNFM